MARDRRTEDAEDPRPDATYVISVAAQLAGMHPQTLRQYDRLGIVVPARRKGRGRSYSADDIERLREVQRLSQEEGINLEGIRRILDLQDRLDALEQAQRMMQARLDEFHERAQRVFAATASGEVSAMRRGQRPWPTSQEEADRRALVLWATGASGARAPLSRRLPPPGRG